MNRIKRKFTLRVVSRLADRACPSTVPRSGEEGQGVNCFITKVDAGEELPIVVLTTTGDEILGLGWDGQKYSIERRIPINDLNWSAYEITHFYGLSEIRYSGLIDFLIGRFTGWPYVKLHAELLIGRADQFFFNKKKLITKRRMELLEVLIQTHLDGSPQFSELSLMTRLYSMRWVEHPDGEAALRQLELYLESLVDSGELRQVNHRYELTGRALKTVEDYEEQERKHTENVKMQRRMLWLTLIIATLAAVQAGLVKLPALIDVTG